MRLVFFINDKKPKTVLNNSTRPIFFSLQGSYHKVEIALYSATNRLCSMEQEGRSSSSQLVLLFDSLLRQQNLAVGDLSFFALDFGPGAFTSLRVTIATVNAFGFAAKIPLVGINGLDALAYQALFEYSKKFYADNFPPLIVVLLNAYNKEAYYGVYSIEFKEAKPDLVCLAPHESENIESLLARINEQFSGQKVLFTGNGAFLHKGLIQEKCGEGAVMQDPILLTCSAHQIADMALKQWQMEGQRVYKIVPYYLKKQTFAVQNS